MRTTPSCFLIALAGALVAVPASAQWSSGASMDMGVNYGQMALSQSAMSGTRTLSKSSRKAVSGEATAKPEPAASAKPFNARFKTDPQVSQLVNQRFARYLAGDDPTAAAEVMRELESGKYRDGFKQLLATNGLAANDLIDVTAAHYSAVWELIQGRKLQPAQVKSIRNQLRQTMQTQPELIGMDEADRQEIAETFMLHTAVAMDGYRTIQSSGDSKLLAQYRAGLQRNLLPEGPDLENLDVGTAGFMAGAQALR